MRSENAESGVRIDVIPPAPTSTESVDTTLSFAMNPEMSAVVILQSAKPTGLKIGAMKPAIIARILVEESVATVICGVKL